MFDARRIILLAHLALFAGAVLDISEMNVAAAGMVATRVEDSSLMKSFESGEISEHAQGMTLKHRRQLNKSDINCLKEKYIRFIHNNTLVFYSHIGFSFLPVPLYISGVFLLKPDSYGNIFPMDDPFHKLLAYMMSPFLFVSKSFSLFYIYDYVQMTFLSFNLIHFSTVFLWSSTKLFRIIAACVITSQLFFVVLNVLIRFSPDYIEDFVGKTSGPVPNLLHRILIVVSILVYLSGWVVLTIKPMFTKNPIDKTISKDNACKGIHRDH
jgi:hypothetical protein